MKVLRKHEILIFSHTGSTSLSDVVDIPGFSCITNATRPYSSKDGGVAIYSKKNIKANLVLCRPEFGMVWIQLGNLHICGCYIPHADSTYLKLEDGNLSLENHFNILGEDISKFQSKGKVILMGDFNSRTGSSTDFLEVEEVEEAYLLTSMHRPPKRSNQDTSPPNKSGKLLLEMCLSSGILIFNGRTLGDLSGEFTFFHVNKNGKSTIDYAIGCPELLRPPYNTSLKVLNGPHLPYMDNGIKFDHAPIILTLNICHGQKEPSPKGTRMSNRRLRWRDEFITPFHKCIASDESVNNLLESALREDVSIDVASTSMLQAIKLAVMNGAPQAYTKAKAGRKGGPTNPWFNAECKAARDAVNAASKQGKHDEVSDCMKEYKKITRKSKNNWANTQADSLINDLYNDPKTFWSKVRTNSQPTSASFSLESWSQYFSTLFTCPKLSNLSTNADNLVGGMIHSALTEAAGHLNKDFCMAEVAGVLDKLRRGSAPGIDGIPAEFFRYGFNGSNEKFCRVITHIFNRALKEGCPEEWTSSIITPVPKPKGDNGVMDDYRGIVVGNSISKIFCSIR